MSHKVFVTFRWGPDRIFLSIGIEWIIASDKEAGIVVLFDVLAAHLSFDGETRGNLGCYGPSVSVSFYLYLFLFSHFKIRLLYMKNVMLRATRTFIEDLCAPEYAHNHLAV